MFCPNCGSSITDDAPFCPNCGTNVRELAEEAQEPAQAEDKKPSVPSQPISDEQATPQDSQAAAATNKSRRPIIIAAAVAVAILVAFVLIRPSTKATSKEAVPTAEPASEESASTEVDSSYTGPTVSLNYLLDDDSQESGETRIAPDSEGNITLPECTVEREGYAFIGWADEYPQQKLKDEPIEPGTQIAMDDAAYTYYAVWRTVATFDGNGADKGQTEPIHTDLSGNIKLPKCGFTRKGYAFVGWVASDPSENDYEPAGKAPGTTEDLFFPTTYYACWCQSVALPEVSVTAPGTLEGDVEGWNSAMGAAVIIVKNDSNSTLEFSANFSTFSTSGSKVEEGMAMKRVIEPGASQPLMCRINSRADKATYTLEAMEPFPGTVAAKEVEVEEVEKSKEGIEARIVNNGSAAPLISSVDFVAKDKEGIQYVGSVYVGTTLNPEEFTDLSIKSESLYRTSLQLNWKDMEMTYYVNGSYQDTGYWQELLEKDLAGN